MNDLARGLLVSAALNGVKQIKHAWADGRGGLCAQGVLIEALEEGCQAGYNMRKCQELHDRALKEYEIDPLEWGEISIANDFRNWDFLTIARKIGNETIGNDEAPEGPGASISS